MSDSSKKPFRWKALAQNLALSCVSLFVFLALCEVGLRFAGYGNVELYEPDPVLYWRLKPNQDCYTKVDRRPVHINSKAVRGPEFELEKPANTVRILSLGDSTTFGWGLSDEETYSRRMEALLNERGKGKPRVEVINCGVNAWSFPQIKAFLLRDGLAWKPDVIVLGGANAWTQFREDASAEFRKAFARRVWLKNFLRRFALYHFVVEVQLKDFYERYRTKFIPVDSSKDTMFKGEQTDHNALNAATLRQICGLAKTNGVKALMLCIPIEDSARTKDYDATVAAKKNAAEEFGQWFLDVEERLKARKERVYLDGDPVHLNPMGNEIVGQALAEFLAQRLFQ